MLVTLLLAGTGAFFLMGTLAEYMSTTYSRSVARDEKRAAVITSMLIEGWRLGAPLITLLFPVDGWVKGVCVGAYVLGVGLGTHIAMIGVQEILQRGRALLQW